jgi:hypothetical protein
LAALATALLRILGGWLVQVGSEIATAEAPQGMLTPQDSKKQLLILAAERIESAPLTPREGGAAANAIQQFLTELRIVNHG